MAEVTLRSHKIIDIVIDTGVVRQTTFEFWANRLWSGSPYAIGPLSVLSVLSCLSVTLVYCGQTVGWIKTPLGKEVGLVPGDIVLDGDPASISRRKGAQQPPLFGPCLLWPNGRPSQILLSSCIIGLQLSVLRFCRFWDLPLAYAVWFTLARMVLNSPSAVIYNNTMSSSRMIFSRYNYLSMWHTHLPDLKHGMRCLPSFRT